MSQHEYNKELRALAREKERQFKTIRFCSIKLGPTSRHVKLPRGLQTDADKLNFYIATKNYKEIMKLTQKAASTYGK